MSSEEATDLSADTEQTEEQEEKGGFFSGLVDKAKDTIDQAKKSIGISTERFKYMFNKFIDGLAVLIVTTCLIPVLVMLFFVWMVKILLGNIKNPE